MKFSENQLREAALCAVEALADSTAYGSEHEFSPEFEAKMDKLLRKMHRRPYVRAAQRAASIILALLVTAGTWLSVDVQAREALIGWVREQYQGFYRYAVPESQERENEKYEISIPEGYSKEDEIRFENSAVCFYRNAEGELLTFGYFTFDQDLYFDPEAAEYRAVTVNGCVADLYIGTSAESNSCIIWTGPDGNVLFQITGYFGAEDLIRLAESVSQKYF